MREPLACSILAIAALGLAACGEPTATATEKARGIRVETARVEVRDLDEALSLTGTLKPHSQVQVVAAVSADLDRLIRDEGARVRRGDVLAELDPTDYRLAEDRARAALAVAEANRAHAAAERDRADNLLKTGGITDKDHLSAQVNLQVAEAALAQARAEAAIARTQLDRCTIRAPFAGRVARRLVDPGTRVSVGTPLFTLVDDSVLEFRAQVPSIDYPKLHKGAPVAVRVDALPGTTIQGRVARVTPLVAERTRTFEAVVEVPGRDDLVGGLFARAEIRTGTVAGALVVPPNALLRNGPGTAEVFVVVKGHAERREASLGIETPEQVQVTEGLAAGDEVVLDPPAALASGAAVEVPRKAPAPTPEAS